MERAKRDAVGEAAALLVGGLAFALFVDWTVLIPWNVSWLGVGDRAMHTLGWFFYRDSPWGWPPGVSPRLGLELSNSIALVDAIPLVAIPLKVLSAWLPRPFQYWGYWWFLCFVLQSLFGYRLARQWGATRLVALAAAGFAVAMPAFLFRLTLHMALASHWLLLAALWLYARRGQAAWWHWPLLVVLTASIHLYILAMVCAVWGASLVARLWSRAIAPLAALGEFALGGALALAAMYLGGVFMVLGSTGGEGYGFYRLNLLAPLITYGVWSRLLPALPHGYYDYEGLSFPGIGLLAVMALALLSGAVFRRERIAVAYWAPLAAVVGLCWVFALSNQIGLLDLSTRPIPIPDVLRALGDMFRSTGRFVWPLLYVVGIGAVVVLGRAWDNRWAVPVLVLALGVQLVDSAPGWLRIRSFIPPPAPTWPTAFVSPAWERVGQGGYTRLRTVPAINFNRDWLAAETFAYRYGLSTDTIYLGRVDQRALAALNAETQLALRAGAPEPQSIYLLELGGARLLQPHVQPADLFAFIDGRIVFARGGAHLLEGLGIAPHGALDMQSWVPVRIAQASGLPY